MTDRSVGVQPANRARPSRAPFRAGPTEYAMTLLAIFAGLGSCALHAGVIPMHRVPPTQPEMPASMLSEISVEPPPADTVIYHA